MDPGFEARLFAGVTEVGGVIPAKAGIHLLFMRHEQFGQGGEPDYNLVAGAIDLPVKNQAAGFIKGLIDLNVAWY